MVFIKQETWLLPRFVGVWSGGGRGLYLPVSGDDDWPRLLLVVLGWEWYWDPLEVIRYRCPAAGDLPPLVVDGCFTQGIFLHRGHGGLMIGSLLEAGWLAPTFWVPDWFGSGWARRRAR